MTRKEFIERSREIMAAKELTEIEKREKLHRAATFLVEDTWYGFAEVRDLMKRWKAAEKEHAGYNGYSYCPHDGEWSPRPPPAITALDREFMGLRHQKINEVYRTAMKTLRKMNTEATA